MKIYLIADTHFNHDNIKTYCQRPDDFSERILRNLRNTLTWNDTLIHLGDVFIGKKPPYLCDWPGKKVLIRGNHDTKHSCTWWMENGFDFACDALQIRSAYLTHKPACGYLPTGCEINIHGHLHNIWHGFHRNADKNGVENRVAREQKLVHKHQRLFSVEYTSYMPVEFEKFVSHPDRYQARGPNAQRGTESGS